MFRKQLDNRLDADSFVSQPPERLILAMIEVHCGAFRIDGRWIIIRDGLRFGSHEGSPQGLFAKTRFAARTTNIALAAR